MSHFTVMIIGENPEQQLAPYQENNMGNCPKEYLKYRYGGEYYENEQAAKDAVGESFDPVENGYWENPNAKWDWYLLGGRWTGYFKVKKHAQLAEIGEPGIMTERAKIGTADQVFKSDIDVNGMRDESGLEAQNTYEKMMHLFGHLPANRTWEDVRESFNGDIAGARQFYHAQPRCAALNASKEWGRSADDFLISQEDYIENARNSALSPYALIKDGQWFQKGKMGWVGMSSNEMTQAEWDQQVSVLMDSLPDDTMISLFDCHI